MFFAETDKIRCLSFPFDCFGNSQVLEIALLKLFHFFRSAIEL